MYTAVYFTF